jgi:hypothetical protein
MKAILCLALLALTALSAQAQKIFGGKTEGGGPGGSPDTNCPCWRYPIRVIGYRKFDLHPLFTWWQDNYAAYKGAIAAAEKDEKPPDFSSLPPSPLPGWQRIKKGRYISDVAYGWLCEAVIEDVPSHAVTNKIIIRNPPKLDKAAWDNLVGRYDELKEEETPTATNAAPKHTHSRRTAYGAVNQGSPDPPVYGQTNSYGTNLAHHSGNPAISNILAALNKFPEGTNYTVDLFAARLGYLQDGSHRQVFDLGQMYVK